MKKSTAPYIVMGRPEEPSDAIKAIAELTGGWTRRMLDGRPDLAFYHNSCVSPPFANTTYLIHGIELTKAQFYEATRLIPTYPV